MVRLVLIVLCLCAIAIVASPAARAADDKSVCNPEEFTISYWSGPPADFNTGERYREVAEANFTLALPADSGMTVADNRKMLDLCKAAGLKAIIYDSRIPLAIGGSAEAKKSGPSSSRARISLPREARSASSAASRARRECTASA